MYGDMACLSLHKENLYSYISIIQQINLFHVSRGLSLNLLDNLLIMWNQYKAMFFLNFRFCSFFGIIYFFVISCFTFCRNFYKQSFGSTRGIRKL